jgi:hypothetical protein
MYHIAQLLGCLDIWATIGQLAETVREAQADSRSYFDAHTPVRVEAHSAATPNVLCDGKIKLPGRQ